jgi:bacteriocin biosynthesis cyclodehydratase domain-containing protein
MRPRLHSHYYLLYEPPADDGEETLTVLSERRTIELKGRFLREFTRHVVPLLDGRRELDEIRSAVADIFAPGDLDTALGILGEQRLLEYVEDGAAIDAETQRLTPQRNYLHELGLDAAQAARQLAAASISVVGAGALGASIVQALAASGVRCFRVVEHRWVRAQDPYLAPIFANADVGRPRVDALRDSVAKTAPLAVISAVTGRPASDADVDAATTGSDLVICAVDGSDVATSYRVNRACFARGIPWISAMVRGYEVVIGPTVEPGRTACYLCATMRAAACATDPYQAFAAQSFFDRQERDDSDRRENLAFGVGMAANLTALEVFKRLCGLPQATLGSLVVFDLVKASLDRYVVLRKPDCPVCFQPETTKAKAER